MPALPTITYTLAGRITNPQGAPQPGLTVRAFDQSPGAQGNPLGDAAVTGADGRYAVTFTRLRLLIGRRVNAAPDVLIRVFDGATQLGESPVQRSIGIAASIDLSVDRAAPAPPPAVARRVHGTVRDVSGGPLAGLTVQAFGRGLRLEQSMGQSATDNTGAYQIPYDPRRILPLGRASVDLAVKAFAADGKLLLSSPIVFAAPADLTLDLTIPTDVLPPPSLFETLGKTLGTLLDGVKASDLEEDQTHQDLSYLANQSGLDKAVLARFAVSQKLAAQAVQAEFWFALLGGSFFHYAEGRSLADQTGGVLDALPALDANAVRKALAASFGLGEISAGLQGSVEAWVQAFLKFSADRSATTGSANPTLIAFALDTAGIAAVDQREKFARLFNAQQALTPPLLDTLAQDPTFDQAQIGSLRASFRLAEITQGDVSVVKMLRQTGNISQPDQIADLAKKSVTDWVSLVQTQQAAGQITVPINQAPIADGVSGLSDPEMYGHVLERQFRTAFPTASFRGGLARTVQNGVTAGFKRADTLGKFLDGHPDFELLNTPVDDFFKNSLQPGFQNLAGDTGFRQELKAAQRVLKLAPSFAAADALLADGFHSARQIYRLGESGFVRRYGQVDGLSPEDARLAWKRAADTHAAVLTIIGDLKSLSGEALPKAIPGGDAALASFPNWNNLFQTGDLCECEDCRSVLSPAAYFADLLMFLRDRQAVHPPDSARDVLFRRRPDLGYLELNCDNALTPLPYIDVVCEVLENVVAAGAGDLPLVGFAAVPADPLAARAAVAAAFTGTGVSLGDDFTVNQVDAADPNRWVVHGDRATYLLKKKGGPDFAAQILPNTKADADELRAYPQYVDATAYATLRQAKFPHALPFDLFAEEIRAGFYKAGLQRWDLMNTLRGPAAPNDPTDGEIAAEYFGISADAAAAFDEKRLVLVADDTQSGQQILWGQTGANWLDAVGNVKTFLRTTDLEYNDLLTLLDLKFINPAGDITVKHLDESCDTAKKAVQPLDPAKLDRLHRFLRLWRKLDGWKLWELDLVIRHPSLGNGHLDEPFLIALFYFERLRKRLGPKATVEATCALLGDLNTTTHFTQLHEPREDALYQKCFLNRKLIKPLDPAFRIDPATGGLPPGTTISAHELPMLAALGLREADLLLLKQLVRASDGQPYIDDKLTLSNLSFLWRHSWLARQLKRSAKDWKILLTIFRKDVGSFTGPRDAWNFVQLTDLVGAAGFDADTLNWILAADLSARPATDEANAARFLTTLRKNLQTILAAYDPAQYAILNPPGDPDSVAALLTTLLQQLNRDEADAQFFIAVLRNQAVQEQPVAGLPAGFDFPAAIRAAVPVGYDAATGTLRFTGLMTAAERTTLLTDPALAAVAGIAAYQQAVGQFFDAPRLALKFFDPVFTAPLASLPPAVNFQTLPDATLAAKISYDSDARELRLAGILTDADRHALLALSVDVAYTAAVNSLAAQPGTVAPPDDRLWLLDADLQFPLANNIAQNLATAARKALAFLSKSRSRDAVIQQAGAQLGLSEALTSALFTEYARLPDTLLVHLTTTFAATSGVVDHTTLPATFDAWYWANRVAAIWKKWNVTAADLQSIITLTGPAQLLDFLALPLNDAAPVAPVDRFVRTRRLLRLRDTLPETGIGLLELLDNLRDGAYTAPADFAAGVELLNETWPAADVAALVVSLDLAYPADYFLAENWERLRQAFYFLSSLNAGAATVKTFAAAAMGAAEAEGLNALLHGKFDETTWLSLSAEIQDALRERKRDALAAYLLAGAPPIDVPTGKWENTDDLYAYYLLDVEMSACLLTSRLVQASGSVQLFVQRCFMGLEPQIVVQASGDSADTAWNWWQWMSKYRVWEANRKIFLWPENWIEPELKQDRSTFFKDLENDLLQNDVNEDSAETAFSNYLEKLDGVAQLEIAGFYQEDNGGDTILHVFGRTPHAQPHLYYYRRYDYRQWTPWEKVDLDIQDDYLVPAVIDRRLFLFWPVFNEVPDDNANSQTAVPSAGNSNFPVQKAGKKLRLQMAVSDYRRGKWTAKRISKDHDESDSYTAEIARRRYLFTFIDGSDNGGQTGIRYSGWSEEADGSAACASLDGSFELSGCHGVPVLGEWFGGILAPVLRPETASVGNRPAYLKWIELDDRLDAPQNDLTLQILTAEQPVLTMLLEQTPWIFEMTPPWHPSYLDRLLAGQGASQAKQTRIVVHGRSAPYGLWMPFFYNDKKRTFFVLPASTRLRVGRGSQPTTAGVRYYPEIKQDVLRQEEDFAAKAQQIADDINLAGLTVAARQALEQSLHANFPDEETPPPYSDAQVRSLLARYFLRAARVYLGKQALGLYQSRRFHFKSFYHPYVCDFARRVYDPSMGIPSLMSRPTQLQDSGFRFRQNYVPTAWVLNPGTEAFYPRETVDFTPDGAYSPYNWELFFHAPLLIANTLSKNQQFELARDWYHYIFNPIGVESPTPGSSALSKYWITKPFFQTTDPQYVQQRIDNLLLMLAGDTSVPGYSPQAQSALEAQVADWRSHPFDPHRVAAYRTVAYQKTVVMKYLDNLVAWGDYLFDQDSMESINEATELYVMAAEILGPRPMKIPPRAKPPLESFNELETKFDALSDALVDVENLVPPLPGDGSGGSDSAPLPMLYFCIPQNDKLLGYWDTVADRLYKIRHCMNRAGVVRQLPLFEPPIDPGLLVKAAAAGIDISSALADLNAPLPLYRFDTMLQRALPMCQDLRELGNGLLAALEKKDSEALGLLRQGQEIRLLEAVRTVRRQQLDEANANLAALRKSREMASIKERYYMTRDSMNKGELAATVLSGLSIASHTAGTIADMLAGVLFLIPDFHIGASGFGGSPHFTAEPPTGKKAAESVARGGNGLYNIATILEKSAILSATIAGYQRRKEEWDFQANLAAKEVEQIEGQIVAAEIRVAIAQSELDNQSLQIDNAHAVDTFLRSKYTNGELYQWQVGQISTVFFQSYRLAYDMAKRAERCFRFELGLQDSSHINFGYWDSLKKGLLSGEQLQGDLRKLEDAYLTGNQRERELIQPVSLALLDPLSLVKLRETGACFFKLPEEIFDVNYPGHYFRRLKSVSITLPCVVGPYTTIPCTLRLLRNSIRINTANGNDGYPRNTDEDGAPADDGRFVENNIPVKAMAASHGQNDSGMFELNFRDERYLPFEGAGAISEWSLELFHDSAANNPDPAHPDYGAPLRQFDYGTITDVILHLKYTAREDAGSFRNGAVSHLRDYYRSGGAGKPAARMFDLRQEFPNQWYRFLHPANPADGNIFSLEMRPDLFPFRDLGKTLKINSISLLARGGNTGNYQVVLSPLPAPPPPGSNVMTLDAVTDYGDLRFGEKVVSALGVQIGQVDPPAVWQLQMLPPGGVQELDVQDIFLVLCYEWA